MIFKAWNNLLVISREDPGSEAILTYDKEFQRFNKYLQHDERLMVLGTLRVLSSVAKNSYRRVRSL